MARMAAVRAQYAEHTVTTTPERLVTMLYDRLVRDLVAGEQALADGDREGSNRELLHAQSILVELLASLDRDAWSGGDRLAGLYVWLVEQLMQANARRDAAQVRSCRTLVEGLADAWHQASASLAQPNGVERAPTTLGAAV